MGGGRQKKEKEKDFKRHLCVREKETTLICYCVRVCIPVFLGVQDLKRLFLFCGVNPTR